MFCDKFGNPIDDNPISFKQMMKDIDVRLQCCGSENSTKRYYALPTAKKLKSPKERIILNGYCYYLKDKYTYYV